MPNNFEYPYDNKPVLRFPLTTSLLPGGLFSKVIDSGYDRYWLLKLSGDGVPKADSKGLNINLLTTQTGLSSRRVAMSQAGVTHLKTASGCIFDYRLVAPAFMLGLEWAKNQNPEQVSAVFDANVNAGPVWTEDMASTPAFLGRPVSATGWQVLVFAGSADEPDMDLQQLTDIELRFSTTYASREPGNPLPSECARIDF